jgi:hypothetical protein
VRYKSSSLVQRGKEFTCHLVFEEEELGALQEQLSKCSVQVTWKRSGSPLEVEQWERFDCIKINKAGVRKRRTLLISPRNKMVHTFKTHALHEGAVTAGSQAWKRIGLHRDSLQLDRMPTDHRW